MSRYRRRRLVNRLMEAIATLAALVAVAVLVIVVVSVARRGAGALSWDFFSKPQALFGQPGGGIANALIGTALLVGLATAMAVPVGVLTAIYLTEFAPRSLAVAVQVVIDVHPLRIEAFGAHANQFQLGQVRAAQLNGGRVTVDQPQRRQGADIIQVQRAVDPAAA